MSEGETIKTSEIILIVLIILIFSWMLFNLNSGDKPRPQASKSSVANMSAIQQMEIAFDGRYSQQEIYDQLTKAMTLYKTPINEENLSRAGSVLVALRKDYGVEEMMILDYMIRSYVEGANINFPDMAGIAVAFLAIGDR